MYQFMQFKVHYLVLMGMFLLIALSPQSVSSVVDVNPPFL